MADVSKLKIVVTVMKILIAVFQSVINVIDNQEGDIYA